MYIKIKKRKRCPPFGGECEKWCAIYNVCSARKSVDKDD